ncbi:MAG: hypothetical protein A2070_00430 [Bdellovibrionales bacterium GWC1_52_8]|nr:MAG: hypothetical protein A2Z97_00560 [Bdellovibrionales bacterium GWB1_52_6]OFZ03256.1 MAG: hypothetical protein A2X97_10050 [Bdellovibrionales bacterium GWA1_52_35]OFZ34630.1 MAG: hypothetical protein A2070_00430 [Bdellovibrionales bacterium GWC1_52_8]HCM40558.1 hypothetical protein [Bdellovibrionales bacterium]
MKDVNKRRIAAIAAGAGLLALTGCGGQANNGGVGGIGGGLIGGCIPITAQIGFTGTNVYYDSSNIRGGLIPGTNQAIGQISVTTAAAGGPYQRQGSDGTISMNVLPQGVVAPQYPYNTGYYPPVNSYQPQGGASVTGFIALSQLVQNDIMMKFSNGMTNTGYAYPYTQPGVVNPYTPQIPNVCVSGVAMDVGHTYQTHMLYGGRFYLYMNNTQNGYILYI